MVTTDDDVQPSEPCVSLLVERREKQTFAKTPFPRCQKEAKRRLKENQ